MAISYTPVDIRGKAFPEVIEELLFGTKTLDQELVTFEDDVKANTIFTESSATVAMQAYTSGVPTSSGTLTSFDTLVTPIKVMFYQEYDMNTIRSSRFNQDMKIGAWNTDSNLYMQTVIDLYNRKCAATTEAKWWNNITSATQTAIAALTPGAGQGSVGAAEQTYAASLTAGQFNGVVTYMIYNASNAAATAGVGGRIKVAGTTISATNIKTEYDKVYAAIPSLVLNQTDEPPMFYVPYSHMQYINQFNNVATNYKDVFITTDLGKPTQKVFFYGLQVNFVPLPENCIIAARKSHICWITDKFDDLSYILTDKAYLNADIKFIKQVFTIFAHVMNQAYNVLYLG